MVSWCKREVSSCTSSPSSGNAVTKDFADTCREGCDRIPLWGWLGWWDTLHGREGILTERDAIYGTPIALLIALTLPQTDFQILGPGGGKLLTLGSCAQCLLDRTYLLELCFCANFADDWDPEEELDEEMMEQLAEEAEAQFRKRNANRDGFRRQRSKSGNATPTGLASGEAHAGHCNYKALMSVQAEEAQFRNANTSQDSFRYGVRRTLHFIGLDVISRLNPR
eukprot:1159804-Pelagomonas_calceolata.AAC.4